MKNIIVSVFIAVFYLGDLSASNIPVEDSMKTQGAAVAAASDSLDILGIQTIAEEGDCSKNVYIISGDVNATTDDGGGFDEITCKVWDDGELKDSMTIKLLVDTTSFVYFQLEFEGLYGTSAAGVGLQCPEIGIDIDPYYPKDVAGVCDEKQECKPKVVVIPMFDAEREPEPIPEPTPEIEPTPQPH